MPTIDANGTDKDIRALLTQLKESGEDIIIANNGKPEAKLTRYKPLVNTTKRSGIFKGQIHIADDFDELPDEILEAFGIND